MKAEIKPAVFELKQLIIPPGTRVQLQNVSWEMFEKILEELGEHRAARVTYNKGILEIRKPLPKHERAKSLIGDMIKALLEELNIDCECYASSTFKRQDMQQGLEPDDCFYIQNESAVRGKIDLDLNEDPPPDLAMEVDNTTKTGLEIYESLGVPELWIYDGRRLKINLLREGQYLESSISNTFPSFPISEVIPQYVEQSKTIGRSATIRAFRAWVREHLQHHSA